MPPSEFCMHKMFKESQQNYAVQKAKVIKQHNIVVTVNLWTLKVSTPATTHSIWKLFNSFVYRTMNYM